MKKRTLIYVLFLVLIFSDCKEIYTTNGVDSKIRKIDSGLSVDFIKILDVFIDSVESNWTLKPENGVENFYYAVKFFKKDKNTLFTIKGSYIFPKYEFFDNTFYKNDTSCMYFFKIQGRNVVIIDYPESKGHGIFTKNLENKLWAVDEMRRNELLLRNKASRPSNPTIYRKTFAVMNETDSIHIVDIDSVILPPPYSSEMRSFIQIIEDN